MFARRRQQTRCRYGVILAALAVIVSACSDSGVDTPSAVVEAIPLAALPGSAQPNLAAGPSGQLVLSWQEPTGDETALRYSTFEGDAWSEPRTVASGDRWFVNWADFPSVVPVNEDLWAAHWLAKREGGTYAYDVAVAISTDAGATWSPPVTPHGDGTATEHGFVSLFPVNGKAGALWLDGRNMSPDSGHAHGGEGGAMTLRSAAIDREARLSGSALVDDRVCDCCQTDVALAGRTPVAVYRNRDGAEIRDIYVTRLEADGWTTGTPVANDRWEIAGCPVNGPAVDAREQRVAVAWFTASGNEPRVRYAVSGDDGAFGPPVDIASGDTLGRVDIVLLDDGGAIVSQLRNVGDGTAEVVLHRVRPDGSPVEWVTAARTGAGRLSGFPQLARYGDDLVIAWTDAGAGGSTLVRSARIAMPVQ